MDLLYNEKEMKTTLKPRGDAAALRHEPLLLFCATRACCWLHGFAQQNLMVQLVHHDFWNKWKKRNEK